MHRRAVFSFLTALALHTAVIFAARSFTSLLPASAPSREAASPSTSHARDVIALDLVPVPDEPQRAPEPAPPLLAANAPRPASELSRPLRRTLPPEPHPGAPEPEPTAPPTSPAMDEYAPNEKPPTLPGLDGKPIWALPGGLPNPALAGPVSADPPPSPFPARDPIQHFPAAGELASALADEVRSSSTPAESQSAFELVIDKAGHLASVGVVAADPAHRKEWERIARAVAQRFVGETLLLPGEFASGSRIRIAVQSRLTMPDGTAHGIPIPKPKLPGVPDEHAIREDSFDDRHRGSARSDLPPIKLGIVLSFSMDVANIGAKRRRIVRTRVQAAPLVAGAEPGAAGAGR